MNSTTDLTCPVCQGDNLTKAIDYASFENHARFPGRTRGLFSMKPFTAKPDRARICLDCGYFMFFVSEERLEEIREKVQKPGRA